MKQKEIWLADLNPIKGSEQSGVRPVVIISGNVMNDILGICIVCPISSKIKHFTGCIVCHKNETNGLSSDSEIITFQVRTLSKERFVKKLGEITNDELAQIKKGLNEILTY
jgi:mRNA interferase MazF